MTYLASHLRPYRYKARHRRRTSVAHIAVASTLVTIWLTAIVAGSNAIGVW